MKATCMKARGTWHVYLAAVIVLAHATAPVLSLQCYNGHFSCYPYCPGLNNRTHGTTHADAVKMGCIKHHDTHSADCDGGLQVHSDNLTTCDEAATHCKRVFIKPSWKHLLFGFQAYMELSCHVPDASLAADPCVDLVETEHIMINPPRNTTEDDRFQGLIQTCCSTDRCNEAPSRTQGASLAALGAAFALMSWHLSGVS